ncbi:MAG TPA: SMP-30/gluconolactonase/LRE family protein [Planctomycetota bacterium]|nr:SMP-30/gluconolactonase/LRE family protein [Planctomycetota bacterium]
MKRYGAVLAFLILAAGGIMAGESYPTFGSITRNDPRLDKLIPTDAKLEKLAEGFNWSEGPIWLPNEKILVFSDVPENVIFKWKEGDKTASVFLKPSGYTGSVPRTGEPGSNGLTLDHEGRLILCEHGDRRVARLEKDGKTKTTLADKFDGKRFNSPNDVVVKSNGDVYFTDPPYGLVKNWDDPARELDWCGVYRISKDGTVTVLHKDLKRPNGLAFSPDEKILYVAQSDHAAPTITAFPVKEDGTLGSGKVFFDCSALAKQKKKGLPDGLKVDKDGNLFATGPGGVLIIAPDGTHLGTIETGEATANCNWGDDGSTLYITADMYLCRVKTSTKGNGWK